MVYTCVSGGAVAGSKSGRGHLERVDAFARLARVIHEMHRSREEGAPPARSTGGESRGDCSVFVLSETRVCQRIYLFNKPPLVLNHKTDCATNCGGAPTTNRHQSGAAPRPQKDPQPAAAVRDCCCGTPARAHTPAKTTRPPHVELSAHAASVLAATPV